MPTTAARPGRVLVHRRRPPVAAERRPSLDIVTLDERIATAATGDGFVVTLPGSP